MTYETYFPPEFDLLNSIPYALALSIKEDDMCEEFSELHLELNDPTRKRLAKEHKTN